MGVTNNNNNPDEILDETTDGKLGDGGETSNTTLTNLNGDVTNVADQIDSNVNNNNATIDLNTAGAGNSSGSGSGSANDNDVINDPPPQPTDQPKKEGWEAVHQDLTQKQLSRKMARLKRNEKQGGARYKSMEKAVAEKGGKLSGEDGEKFGAWKGGKSFSETKLGGGGSGKASKGIKKAGEAVGGAGKAVGEGFKNFAGKIGKLFGKG
jgi:hypothetical protein